ncbi:MAG: zinc ribbon domain-containing protein [Anaerolineaceae bacterium]
MTFDPSILSNFFLIGVGFGTAFIVALWVSLVIWTFRDIRIRTKDPFIRILALLVSAVLFLPGVIIYFVLRPPHTIEEEYQKVLEEEALLQTIESKPVCPGCGRKVQETWMVCPGCQTVLKKKCQHCGQLLELPWKVCPYCGQTASALKIEEVKKFELS